MEQNLVIFAGILFGKRLFDLPAVLDAVSAFAIFCAVSGVVYIVNEIADCDADRSHPLKARRPIASGALPVRVAAAFALVLGGSALSAAWVIDARWPNTTRIFWIR
jgi:4-hydroxybenzoate polyprenyltransferase